MWEWCKAKGRYLFQHRTKIAGALGMAAGFAENNLAQLGHIIPPAWQGIIVATLGVIVFVIGLFNSLTM